MQNWKRFFRTIILERGMDYFERNRVSGLTYDDFIYKARVLGDKAYNVEIKIRNQDIIYMKCSCPHAKSGSYCKHMAAVMYAIEEQGEKLKNEKEKESEKMLQPFERSKEKYQFFDMGKITKDMLFGEKLYETAKKLVEKKKVVLDGVTLRYFRFLDGMELGGIAKGYYLGDSYPKELEIKFKRTEIFQAICRAAGCQGVYGDNYYRDDYICEHLLALLILVDEYLKKHNPGDSTDPEGFAVMSGFRQQHFKEVLGKNVEETKDFTIEPALERNGEYLNVSLKGGTDKLYVIRNLPEFVEQYEEKAQMKFGTKTEIDLAKHRMSLESEPLYEFVKGVIKQEQLRNEHLRGTYKYYYDIETIKNQISLYGERLDQFFDLYENQEVACNDKSNRRNAKTILLLKNGKPSIKLNITKDMDSEGTFHGVHVEGKIPTTIKGKKYNYYFAKNALCRIDEKVMEEILPLYQMENQDEIDFYVGRKNLSEFYHQILPVLKRNITVKEYDPEVIHEFVPPQPVFCFYLDSEKGNAMCKPKARYGEETVSVLDVWRNDRKYDVFRNPNLEREMLFQLSDLFKETDLEKDEMHCGNSEDAILKLLDGGLERLMSLGEVHTTDRFKNLNIKKKPKLQVGVSVESDLMNLTISSEDIDQEELLYILQNYQRKKKYYRLKNGDFVSMNEQDMETLNQLMNTLQISDKEFLKGNIKVPMYRALYLNKMLEQSENVYLERDKHFKKLVKEFKTVEDSEFELPVSLKPIMRNYQKHGFRWLKTLENYGFGGILADDMGLGKTLQVISVLLDAKEKGELQTALVVSPASLVYNWKEEFHKFAPQLNVIPVVGTQAERAEIIGKYKDTDVLITSYDLLKRDIAEYEEKKFTYQIIDEAQYIKNHTTAAAKSVKVIQSKHKFALTGTPIENRLSELWSIFDYLIPGFLYGYDTFRKQMETPIVKYKEKDVSEQLKKMVAPFILRRLKGDVLKDLPDKIEEIRYARLEGEQQQLYDAQVVHMREVVASQEAEDFQKSKLQILAELTKIRQICCDPELLFEKYGGESAKRLACMELIQSAIEGEHKVLVFSQFTSMLELLESDLTKQKISYYKITGETAKEKRLEMVNAFNTDDTPVFLISLKAGGTGLNLIGADVVIHYDPWWNLAVQNQATDRVHRIGQTKVVSVYKLIAKDTIEEKIVKMQESKKDLADSILSGNMGGITQMSKEELLELIG